MNRRILLPLAGALALVLVAFLLTGSALAGPPKPPVPGAADQPTAAPPISPLDPYDYDLCGLLWRVVSTPNLSGNSYSAVSALDAHDIWTVGTHYRDGGIESPIASHWNGSIWNTTEINNGGILSNTLNGVVAVGVNNVWAVGASEYGPRGGRWQPLVEHWNGSSWLADFPPNPLARINILTAVAAMGPNDVWAVGYSQNYIPPFQTLIEHWNGSAWTVVPSPSPGTYESRLSGISIGGPNDIWAVGYTLDRNNTGLRRPLALHWNGVNWSNFISAPVANYADFNAVKVLGPSDVWAVGANNDQPLIEHWNGGGWVIVSSPNFAPFSASLTAVSATGTNDVWAVGSYSRERGNYALIEHWNGSAWTINPDPVFVPMNSSLAGVAAVAPTDVWAVGNSGYWTLKTLIEHYSNVPCPTSTPTITPTPIPTCPVPQDYIYNTTTSGMALGTTDIGNHCDDCITNVALPFSYLFYNQSFDHVNISSNGNLQFASSSNAWTNSCAPYPSFNYTMMPYWDDLTTVNNAACPSGKCGIFTRDFGSAFVIEWRALKLDGGGYVNFAAIFYESIQRVDFIYGAGVDNGVGATAALQEGSGSHYVLYSCNTAALTPGLEIIWNLSACTTPTPSATLTATTAPSAPLPSQNSGGPSATPVPSATATDTPGPTHTPQPSQTPGGPSATPVPSDTPTPIPTQTATQPPTSTPPATQTPSAPTATPVLCTVAFSDVAPTNPFYAYVRCLVCRGIISGYGDSTFRPYNQITRGQISKMAVLAAGLGDPIPSGQQTFEDVATAQPFWPFIEVLAGRGYISGYACGGTGEPCVPPANRPYFRPNANITRGQIAKIDSNTAGYTDPIPSASQKFADVSSSNPFWLFVERVNQHGVISGYACGAAGEPCTPPDNLPYFRPYGNATRGQGAKIVSNTFYPNCVTPAGAKR